MNLPKDYWDKILKEKKIITPVEFFRIKDRIMIGELPIFDKLDKEIIRLFKELKAVYCPDYENFILNELPKNRMSNALIIEFLEFCDFITKMLEITEKRKKLFKINFNRRITK